MEEIPVLLRILPAIIVLFLLILIIAIYIKFNLQQPSRDEQILEGVRAFENRAAQAIWAGASIVSLRSQKILEDAAGTVKAELTLLVQPPDGEAYPASTVWRINISALASVQPGQSVSVKIDQLDPQIIYPNVSWAQYWVWN